MARKYINLFDEQGNLIRVPLGADAENVDIDSINGLEADNVQEALEELAGNQTSIEMDDVPTSGSNKAVKSGGVYTALATKQASLTAGENITINSQNVISAKGGNLNMFSSNSPKNLMDYETIEIDVTGNYFLWATDKKIVASNNTLSAVDAEGYKYMNGAGSIKLFAGDVFVTNADSDGVLIAKATGSWVGNVNTRANVLSGRNLFDGKYVAYKASTDCYLTVSYKTNVNYDVHFFVIRKGCVELPLVLHAGYLNNSFGYAVVEQDAPYWSVGRNTVVSDYINIENGEGRYLFIPEGLVASNNVTLYTKYLQMAADPLDEKSSDVYSFVFTDEWTKPYLIVPILESQVYYRVCMYLSYASTARAYLVTEQWLKNRGFIDQWANKKWLMYGDSYIKGHTLGYAWHKFFTIEHHSIYTNKGENGIGLVLSPNLNYSLLSKLEERLLDNGQPLDVDVIGITCGRNDYSRGVPIGDIDDMLEMIEGKTSWTTVNDYGGDATFMGALNYLCKWLIEHYTTKKIFFITPWYFLSTNSSQVAEPAEYVDAVLKVTGKWGIPCFDAARRSGIAVQDETFRSTYFLSSSDTSHLNRSGHLRMAHGPVCKWLENLFSE